MVSLMGDGVFGARLRALGIPVFTLHKPRGRITLTGLIRLAGIVRSTKPDVVQTWMYHADLVGGVVARAVGAGPVVWGIRHSDLDPKRTRRSTRMTAHVCSWLSNFLPAAICCCSERAAQIHAELGYAADKFVVIPNGFDTSILHPDVTERARVRRELRIADDQLLIGMVARWDPQKDHRSLLEAYASTRDVLPRTRLALVGAGISRENTALRGIVSSLGLEKFVILAGSRSDIPAVMSAMDVHVLSSAYGEAFPNVVAEAMACGALCVVTDVGDSAKIVGDSGWTVPPGRSNLLADALVRAVRAAGSEEGRLRRNAGIRRVHDTYGITRMIDSYRELWATVLAQGRPTR